MKFKFKIQQYQTDAVERTVEDYAIADFSLIICYIVAGAAILSAFISVIIGFFKK